MKSARKLLIIVFLGLAACSSKQPADTGLNGAAPEASPNTPGSAEMAGPRSITISPADATRVSSLRITPKGFNIEDAQISWLLNGVPVDGQSGYVFRADGTKKGDIVEARAVVNGREIVSNDITIGNTPPQITEADTAPDPSNPELLSVDARTEDADGDPVTLRYEWKKNGEPAGEDKTIGAPIRRGDRISVRVVPFDGESYGRPVVMNRQMNNLPPMIAEDDTFNFDGNIFSCRIPASDPDSDLLTYSLKKAPPGMKIDPATGRVAWKVPPDFKGRVSFTVSVTDGKGGEAVKACNVDVGEPLR